MVVETLEVKTNAKLILTQELLDVWESVEADTLLLEMKIDVTAPIKTQPVLQRAVRHGAGGDREGGDDQWRLVDL